MVDGQASQRNFQLPQSSGNQSVENEGTEAVQFQKDKYLVVKGLLDEPLLGTVYAYAVKKSLSGSMALGDVQVPGTPSCYGDTFMEMLLELFRPRLERLTGLKLHPTYSYFRIYKHGDVLESHTDRPSCEISLSLTLGFEAAKPWPIFFEVNDLAGFCAPDKGFTQAFMVFLAIIRDSTWVRGVDITLVCFSL